MGDYFIPLTMITIVLAALIGGAGEMFNRPGLILPASLLCLAASLILLVGVGLGWGQL